ncbi:MAG: GtrA family protein [Oscillospiraceae bacterium]
MNKEKFLKLFFEFFRYAVVGGISFVVDSGVLYLFKLLLLRLNVPAGLFLATAAGFIAGLIVNYILSIIFVFKKIENNGSAKKPKGFIVFTVIGLIGLALTELGMHLGVIVLKMDLILTKIVVASVVLVWNYCGRKIFVFGGKEKQ